LSRFIGKCGLSRRKKPLVKKLAGCPGKHTFPHFPSEKWQALVTANSWSISCQSYVAPGRTWVRQAGRELWPFRGPVRPAHDIACGLPPADHAQDCRVHPYSTRSQFRDYLYLPQYQPRASRISMTGIHHPAQKGQSCGWLRVNICSHCLACRHHLCRTPVSLILFQAHGRDALAKSAFHGSEDAAAAAKHSDLHSDLGSELYKFTPGIAWIMSARAAEKIRPSRCGEVAGSW